jgi:hypothetical protein
MAWFKDGGEAEAAQNAPPRGRSSALRKVALGAFALATALVVACGHQVTPEPNLANSNLAGDVLARFDTVGTLNFTSYSYAIVINSCGSGLVPYPNVYGTSYQAYSYVFFVGGSTSGSSQVTLYEYYYTNNTPTRLQIPINPSLIQFNPDSNELNTEFTLIFSRSLLNNYFHLAPPCSNATQPPATPTPIGTVAPTIAPTSGASPVPTTTPVPSPTTSAQSTWIFNYITFSGTPPVGVPQDSLGVGGPTDNTFQGIDIDVNTLDFDPIFRNTPNQIPNNQSAQIAGGEIDNYP